jgi:hypothetical protein
MKGRAAATSAILFPSTPLSHPLLAPFVSGSFTYYLPLSCHGIQSRSAALPGVEEKWKENERKYAEAGEAGEAVESGDLGALG